MAQKADSRNRGPAGPVDMYVTLRGLWDPKVLGLWFILKLYLMRNRNVGIEFKINYDNGETSGIEHGDQKWKSKWKPLFRL